MRVNGKYSFWIISACAMSLRNNPHNGCCNGLVGECWTTDFNSIMTSSSNYSLQIVGAMSSEDGFTSIRLHNRIASLKFLRSNLKHLTNEKREREKARKKTILKAFQSCDMAGIVCYDEDDDDNESIQCGKEELNSLRRRRCRSKTMNKNGRWNETE